MLIFELLAYLLLALIMGLLGYQAFLSLVALFSRRLQSLHSENKRKFAIVLSAVGKERVLAKTLYSLFGLVYPKNLFDVILITDKTADPITGLAKNLGALVVDWNQESAQNTNSLKEAFAHITGRKNYDALIVFEPHSLISGDYLDVMNYYLEQGSKVIQSSNLVIAQNGNWTSEFKRINFLISNYVKPIGRKLLGLGVGLRAGNGICFSKEILHEIPWDSWSLSRDLEYMLELQLRGVEMDFAPEASVWTEKPIWIDDVELPHRGWEIARYPLIKKYAAIFFKESVRKKSPGLLDVFIDLITPPLMNLSLFAMMMFGMSTVLWLAGWLSIFFIWGWAATIVVVFIHLLVGMYTAGADREMYKSFLIIPLYVAWKLKAKVSMFVSKRERMWVRSIRE